MSVWKAWYKVKRHMLAMIVSLPITALAGLPLLYLAIRGLAAGRGVWEVIFSQRTGQLLANTFTLSAAVLSVCLVISLPLAWLTTQTNVPGRRLLTVLGTAPIAVPSYIGAYALITALGPGGMIVELARRWLGLIIRPQVYGFAGAVTALSLYTYPYLFINLRTAFLSSDEALKEASYSLGFGRFATFVRVTLPAVIPGMASGAILVLLYTIGDFGAVSFLRYDTIVRAIYIQYEAAFNRGYAAALGLVITVLSALLLLLKSRVQQSHLSIGSARNRRPGRLVDLGVWRWPVSVVAYSIPVFALGLPVLVTGYWLVRGMAFGETLILSMDSVIGTFGVAAAGALAAGFAGLGVGYVSLRHHSNPAVRLIENAVYLQYGLPSIAVALSFVFFAIRFAYPVYQTFYLLITAYVLRFLPHAAGASKTALAQIHPRLYEGARSLGASQSRIFKTLTWPLARPGILGGMALVFLNIVKELPLTLVLSPAGFETLAANMWGSMEEAFYARASVPALIIILFSALSVAGVIPKSD